MRILCFIDNLGAGGAQRQMVGLAKMLKDKTNDVKVLSYQDDNFFASELKKGGICYQIIKNNGGKFGLFLNIKNAFSNYNPDVVISYLESPSIIACFMRLFGNKFQLIVSERNTNTSFLLRDKIRFQLFRVANWVVPNSYSQERFIREKASYLSKKLCTITNFCSYLDIKPFRKIRKDVPEILVVASIWPPKNTIGFIRAVRILKDQGHQFHVKWYGKVGETDYFKQCCELIESLGISDKIQLLEKTKNLEDVYRNSDYFCLPSFYEGTPNVICEAICMNLPIICSNVCDNSLFVHDGENGYLFDPNNPDDIANKIKETISIDNADYCLFSRKSREIAESLLSEEVFVNKYMKLIEEHE